MRHLFWVDKGKHVIRVMFGEVLEPAPEGWPFPASTRWNLWIWTAMRPRHKGWRRHVDHTQTTILKRWCWGPFELDRTRPAPRRPDLFWRFTAERHYARQSARS